MEKHCENEECKNFWSCKMLIDRFGVKECFPLRKWIVNLRHKEELKNRKELLEGRRKYEL